jgi:tetratricopeptide (TPR) repeat protein/DNA-binding CsgD family transcriptional regulator
MTHYKAIALLLGILFSLGALAQDSKLDSLLKALPHSRDTMKVNVLNQISKRYWYADPPKARQYAGEALKLSRTIRFGKGEALAYNNMGIGYYLQNDYSNALKYFTESIKANGSLGNQKGIGDTYNNMGLISIKQSNYPQALDYYLLSLKTYEERGDVRGTVGILSNIGNLYDDLQEYPTALEYYFKALKIVGNTPVEDDGLGLLHNNIGSVYLNVKKYPEALKYLFQSLKTRDASDELGKAISLSNIGLVYMEIKQYPQALDYFSRALPIQQSMEDDFHMLSTLEGLAQIYLLKNDLPKSRSYASQELQIALKIDNKKRAANAYRILAEISKRENDPGAAYENQLRYSQTRDSILNDDNTLKIARMQIRYEGEKKQAEIKLLKKEQSFDQLIRNLFGAGLLACLVIAGLLVSRQRLKIKDEKILAEKERQILVIELESRSKALTTHTLNLIQKNGIMQEIRETVSLALKSPARDENSPLLNRLIKLIDYSFNLDKDWEEFKLYFEQVHQNFFVKLQQDHPDLSPGEMRLCALIRLNMNLKECATLLSVSPDSIKTARHRLRKKLGLSDEQNLVGYFTSI